MLNPIMQALMPKQNNLFSQLSQIKNPEAYFNNPQFKSFVEANKGKSADQIARENGIDPSILKLFR